MIRHGLVASLLALAPGLAAAQGVDPTTGNRTASSEVTVTAVGGARAGIEVGAIGAYAFAHVGYGHTTDLWGGHAYDIGAAMDFTAGPIVRPGIHGGLAESNGFDSGSGLVVDQLCRRRGPLA